MHECPTCGQACDCDGEDVWNDAASRACTHPECEGDEDWFCGDDGDDYDACVDCGSPNVSDQCQCCGGDLCYMHSETGAGFCKNCPTPDWIAEQSRRAQAEINAAWLNSEVQ